MAKFLCRGDHYNCECPHCGKNNSYVDQLAGVIIPKETALKFEHPCYWCRELVYYVAERGRDAQKFPVVLLLASIQPHT